MMSDSQKADRTFSGILFKCATTAEFVRMHSEIAASAISKALDYTSVNMRHELIAKDMPAQIYQAIFFWLDGYGAGQAAMQK